MSETDEKKMNEILELKKAIEIDIEKRMRGVYNKITDMYGYDEAPESKLFEKALEINQIIDFAFENDSLKNATEIIKGIPDYLKADYIGVLIAQKPQERLISTIKEIFPEISQSDFCSQCISAAEFLQKIIAVHEQIVEKDLND